jgi:hypothetical protein
MKADPKQKQKLNPIPRGATHVKLITSDRKKAFDEVKNIDCYQGSPGKLTFFKKTREKLVELDSIEFDGVWPPREEDSDMPRVIT